MSKIVGKYPIFCIWFLYLAWQFTLTMTLCNWNFSSWIDAHTYLDSNWYIHLSTNGYEKSSWAPEGAQYAFFPLWSIVLKIFLTFIPNHYIHIAGVSISVCLFYLTLRILVKNFSHITPSSIWPENNVKYRNQNIYALLPLIFAPGSWVFFSNHTESIFLLFTVLAFTNVFHGKIIWAAIFAGLSTLTRNQGVFVAIAIGIVTLFNSEIILRQRIINFIKIGSIAISFFSTWYIFLYLKTGSIFASSEAQKFWKVPASFSEYLSNYFWISPMTLPKAFWFWAFIVFSIYLIYKNKNRFNLRFAYAFYIFASVSIWPIQGANFQSYRYGLVLFPFWIFCGTKLLEMFNSENRTKKAISIAFYFILLAIQIRISSFYFLKTTWPY